MLCVLIFVNIPLLLAQSFLLTKAGFAPSSHLLGLLWLQLLWILILNLPVVTLATVTASIGQFILAVLCVLLYLIGGAALDSVIPSSGVAPDSLLDSVEPALVVATALAVIVWQYSRRRTGQSRFALIGVAAAVLSTLVLTPFRALIDRTYPQATPGRPLPIHLAFDLAKPTSRGDGFPE